MPSEHRALHASHMVQAFARRKFLILFLFLLVSLLIYPYAESNAFAYYTFRVLGSTTIVICVYAASFRRSLVITAIILAIPAFLLRGLNLTVSASSLSILNVVLSFLFDALIVVAIFRRVVAPGQPNSETIFSALSLYLLVGFAFASIYGMVALVQPRAFYLDPLTNFHTRPDRLDFIYYSFATITSLGAAGITPVSGEARCVSVIEAILGVLYLAVLISRLIGAYRHPTS
jgi:Ion channel